MSRGKWMLFALVALTAISALVVTPATAATTSGAVAATDERAPEAVSNVQAFLGADGVEVSWDLSPSDFVRQSPSGSDFTSGGTFVNINDVSGYNILRAEGGLAAELVGTVAHGETTFVDALPIGSVLVYSVAAVDAAGNPSAPAEALGLSLGAAPIAVFGPNFVNGEEVVSPVDLGVVAVDGSAVLNLNTNNTATEADALMQVSVAITGAGYTSSFESFEVSPASGQGWTVTFNASDVGNLNGTYVGTLTIRTNDPNNRESVIELAAEIVDGIGLPEISIAPASLSFGGIVVDQTPSRVLTITNAGGPTLAGAVSISGDAAFTISGDGTYSLAAAGTEAVTVTFAPTDSISYSATITVTSNDDNEASTEIAVTGRGTGQPEGPAVIVIQKTVINLPFGGTLTIPGLGPINASDNAAVDAFLIDVVAVATATVEMGKSVAEAMGIDPARIRNGRWIKGSLIFVFDVAPAAEGSTEPTPAAALANLETTLADTTTANPVTDIGAPSPVTSAVVVETLVPVDDLGNPVLGWFTKGANGAQVGFDDFFAFADEFGKTDGDADFDAAFDISSTTGDPDGAINFDDFFAFADNFGKTVANADAIIAALQ